MYIKLFSQFSLCFSNSHYYTESTIKMTKNYQFFFKVGKPYKISNGTNTGFLLLY